jgi:hypothetical protein
LLLRKWGHVTCLRPYFFLSPGAFIFTPLNLIKQEKH